MEKKLIHEHLDRLLQNPIFNKSHRTKALLSYIVEKALSGEDHNIKELTLAMDVFGRCSTFNTADNSLIRVAVYKLRNKLKKYYKTDGKFDEVQIEIPSGRYIAVFKFPQDHPIINSISENPDANIAIDDQPFILLHFDPLKNPELKNTVHRDRIIGFSNSILNHLKTFSTTKISCNISNSDYDISITSLMERENLIFFITVEDLFYSEINWNEKVVFSNQCGSFIDWMETTSSQIALQVGGSLGILFRNKVEHCDDKKSIRDQLLSEFIRPIYSVDPDVVKNSIFKLSEFGGKFLNNHAIEGGISHLYSMKYLFDNTIDSDFLHQSRELYERALLYEPVNVLALLSKTRIHHIMNDHLKVKEDTEAIIATYGNYSLFTAQAAYYNAIASGDWEKQMSVINRIIKKCSCYPPFLHFFLFLYEMRSNNLEKALSDFRKIPYSKAAPYQLLSISLFAQMDNMKEVDHILLRNRALNPGFELDIDRYLSVIKGDELLFSSIEAGIRKVSNF